METFRILVLLLIKSSTLWYIDRIATSSYTGVIHCKKCSVFLAHHAYMGYVPHFYNIIRLAIMGVHRLHSLHNVHYTKIRIDLKVVDSSLSRCNSVWIYTYVTVFYKTVTYTLRRHPSLALLRYRPWSSADMGKGQCNCPFAPGNVVTCFCAVV